MINIWQKTIDYGYYVRSNNLNGEQKWKDYKENHQYTNYYQLTDEIINLIKLVDYTYIDDQKEQQDSSIKIKNTIYFNKINDIIIDKNHFIIQLFRIPNMAENKKISAIKLLQIAYNIGQAKYFFGKGKYPYTLDEFYHQNNLDHLETFIQI